MPEASGHHPGYYSHRTNDRTKSQQETAIRHVRRICGSGTGKGTVGMACLCSVLSVLQLGGPEGWGWLDSWELEHSEGSLFTHLASGPRLMARAPTCGCPCGRLPHGSLKVSGFLT